LGTLAQKTSFAQVSLRMSYVDLWCLLMASVTASFLPTLSKVVLIDLKSARRHVKEIFWTITPELGQLH
jgi:hypothetical protein